MDKKWITVFVDKRVIKIHALEPEVKSIRRKLEEAMDLKAIIELVIETDHGNAITVISGKHISSFTISDHEIA